MEPKRLLKNVQVFFISLVDKGANQRTVIWKSSASREPLFQREIPIKKVDEEKRLVYGIVYAPDEADSQGDMMTAAEIEKMAYGFMANRRTDQVDRQHDYNPDEGFVAESWMVRKSDPLFPDEPEGSWAVGIKVVQEETWAAVKSGEVSGLSMGGFANAEDLSKSDNHLNPPLKGGNKKEERGIVDKVKEGLSQFFRLGVKKDFEGEFQARTIGDAIWALDDALVKILNDETVTDKKAAINESVNQFLSFVNNEGAIPMAKEEKEERGAKSEERKEEETPNTTEIKKEQVDQLIAKVDELLETVKTLEERLAKVEKAHPGKQSANGRDDNPEDKKGYKGLPII